MTKTLPWTDDELRAAVVAYLKIQRDTDDGKKVCKAHVWRGLAARFPRTAKSFEFRAQNISHALDTMGREWIAGLKPASHVGAKMLARLRSIIDHEAQRLIDDALAERPANWGELINRALHGDDCSS